MGQIEAPPLAPSVEAIEKTAIRTMYDLAEAHAGDLVRMELGEPDFDTPGHIIDAAATAARDGATHYTPNAGIPALREAIAEKTRRDHELAIEPSDVVATAGASEAILLVLYSVAEPGSEVVLPTPAWPQYRLQTRLAGAEPVQVPLDPATGFDLDPDRVIEAMTDATACVLLNSPSNPSARVYDLAGVRRVVEAAADHGAYVVLDEVYASLNYEGSARSLAADIDAPNVVVINACSKQYAMTGWRLGWLIGPEPIVEATIKLHPGTTTCPASVSQHAAIAALTGSQEPAREMYEAFRERRDYVQARVGEIPGVSCPPLDGGFYAFADFSRFDGSSFEIAKRLLEEYGVVSVPGAGFGQGGEGHLRFSFATGLDQLETGFDRIERFARDELG